MLQPFFDFLEKWITDFTWKRPMILVGLFASVLVAFYAWEASTSTFQLQKYERTVDILEKLSHLKTLEPEELFVKKQVVNGLQAITETRDTFLFVGFELSEALTQAFWGSLIWLIFVIAMLPEFLKGKEGSSASLFGALIIFFAVALLAYFVPTEWPKWIFPICFNVLLIGILMLYGNKGKS